MFHAVVTIQKVENMWCDERSNRVNRVVYGPAIGSFLGKPIFQTIEKDGKKYQFDRMAECDSDGCPLQQLASNEVMFNPGLIYKKTS